MRQNVVVVSAEWLIAAISDVKGISEARSGQEHFGQTLRRPVEIDLFNIQAIDRWIPI
jgi:hypothetical protein